MPHRLHEDTWLESLKLATAAPQAVGLRPTRRHRCRGAARRAGARPGDPGRPPRRWLALVAGKLPGGGRGAALFADLDALLADARAMALGRLLPAGGR